MTSAQRPAAMVVLLLAALLPSTLPLAAADAGDLTGAWVGRLEAVTDLRPVEQPRTIATLSLVQTGSLLTGTITGGDFKGIPIEGGRIDESGKITFWLRDSQNFRLTADLMASGGWMRGRITSSTGRLMTVALKKQ